MSDFSPPVVASDQGDVYVFDDPAGASADIEATDAAGMEFFDAAGHRLRPVVDRQRWSLDTGDLGAPDPDRVLALLHSYFARLPEQLSRYAAQAEAAVTLDDLLALWRELASEPALDRRFVLFRRFRR